MNYTNTNFIAYRKSPKLWGRLLQSKMALAQE